jgi:quercetin dioxygenase-like cupin family protein
MKRNAWRWAAVAAATMLAGGGRGAFAQDPAVVNAFEIRVKFENARVRVLEATLGPGQKEQMHTHPEYVIQVLAGGKVRTHGADGSVNDAELKDGDVLYRGPVTHWAENIGTTTIHMLLVELKETAKAGP